MGSRSKFLISWQAEPLPAGNYLPCGHPVKSENADLLTLFSNTLDWAPAYGMGSRLWKLFRQIRAPLLEK